MKTREQLRAEGKELHGPIVPEWFKAQSDGCSIRTRAGRFFLKAEQARAACYIHDFEYYLVALEWHEGSPEWVGDRMKADYRLEQNRALIGRNKAIGWIYARLYYRFVRLFGRFAVKPPAELVIPPTVKDIEALGEHLHKPFTPLAKKTLKKWIQLHDR